MDKEDGFLVLEWRKAYYLICLFTLYFISVFVLHEVLASRAWDLCYGRVRVKGGERMALYNILFSKTVFGEY